MSEHPPPSPPLVVAARADEPVLPTEHMPACIRLAELVCADDALLRLEFDSIIAANFPAGAGQHSPPLAVNRAHQHPAGALAPRPDTLASTAGVGSSQHVPRQVLARERSPPLSRPSWPSPVDKEVV
jgi:hypothetical protein